MPIHVLPAHTRMMQTLKGHPQVTVLHGGVGRCDPAAPAPGGEPFGEPVDDISTIGKDGDLGARMQRLQGGNSRHQLHAIVRCCRDPAAQFTHPAIGVENTHPPAARPGVPQACSIGISYRTVHTSALQACCLLRLLRSWEYSKIRTSMESLATHREDFSTVPWSRHAPIS